MEAGRSHGPAFGDQQGNILETVFIKALLADRLQQIQEWNRILYPVRWTVTNILVSAGPFGAAPHPLPMLGAWTRTLWI